MSKKTKETTTIDILGDTWAARHLAQHLLSTSISGPKLHLRLWNDKIKRAKDNEEMPRMMLVPEFLKDHKGLGYRTSCESTLIHHKRRQRCYWSDPSTTAKELGCCPEIVAVLHNLVFLNSYGAKVLGANKKLKAVNFDWQKNYSAKPPKDFTPKTAVIASKASIERVWDNTITNAGAKVQFDDSIGVESVREPSASGGLALILSAPHGIQDDTNHVVKTRIHTTAPWAWRSYQCLISRELIASMPRFFIWIDPGYGEDFLSTGLLYDGAIFRVITVPLPQNEDLLLVQVDRLTDIITERPSDPSKFFYGSPWAELQKQEWKQLPPIHPDDLIYGNRSNLIEIRKQITQKTILKFSASASGVEHHMIG
jgi:hypothetical protein